MAASAGHLRVVELLLGRGADVDGRTDGGHSALQYAASRDRRDVVELLLHHRADPDVADGTTGFFLGFTALLNHLWVDSGLYRVSIGFCQIAISRVNWILSGNQFDQTRLLRIHLHTTSLFY